MEKTGLVMLIPISLEASRVLLTGTLLKMKSIGLLQHPATLAGMEEEVSPSLDYIRVLNCESEHCM